MRCPVCEEGTLELLDVVGMRTDRPVEEYRCNRCPYITEVYR